MKHVWHTLGPRGGGKSYETAEGVMLSSEIWPPMAPHPASVTLVVPWEAAVAGGLVVASKAKPAVKGEAASLAMARSYTEELPEPVPLPLEGPDDPDELPNAVIPHDEEAVPDPSGSLWPDLQQ